MELDKILYTYGYGNRTPEQTLAILGAAGIQVVVDVRRQFSKSWCLKYWNNGL